MGSTVEDVPVLIARLDKTVKAFCGKAAGAGKEQEGKEAAAGGLSGSERSGAVKREPAEGGQPPHVPAHGSIKEGRKADPCGAAAVASGGAEDATVGPEGHGGQAGQAAGTGTSSGTPPTGTSGLEGSSGAASGAGS